MKKILTIFGGSGFLGKSFIDCFKNGILQKFDIDKLNIISRSAATKFKFNENSKIRSFNYDFLNNYFTIDFQVRSNHIIIREKKYV